MKSLSDYSLVELRWVIALREKIEALQGELDAIIGEVAVSTSNEAPAPAKRKYHMSAAHKRKLIKALKKARKIRWANAKAAKPAKKDRRSSPATRAKLRAAAKARWARVRAEGKTRL
jgi:phage protein D